MDGYLIALILLIAWIIVLIIGRRLKFWEKVHSQLWGPFLMVKTVKGRQFIDRLARRKGFWKTYGKISIIVTIGSMIVLTAILLWEATLVVMLPQRFAPSPEMLLGLPGINPIIPIWYGILGIAVAIIIHEFAHGILSRAADIKVESLGLVFLIVPMGAFVEPNEEEIKKTERRNRMRLFAAGPGTNMLAAFVCFIVMILVLSPSIAHVSPGAVVTVVAADSPAAEFGISKWSEILAVDGEAVSTLDDFSNLTFDHPGDAVDVRVLYTGNISVKHLPGGIAVTSISANSPAERAGIKVGMIIESLNNEVINNASELTSVIRNSTRDAPIGVTVLKFGYDQSLGKSWFVKDLNITSITLVDKWAYLQQYSPKENDESFKGVSFMGIGSGAMGISAIDADYIPSLYASSPVSGDPIISSFRIIALPLWGFSPVEGPMADLYEPTGALAGLPNSVFWVLTNSVYWIFWINLMVGLTNALPAVPLDGGYVFRDLLKGFFEKVNSRRQRAAEALRKKLYTDEEVERFISAISLSLSVIVLFLILWQLIGPRLF